MRFELNPFNQEGDESVYQKNHHHTFYDFI